MAQIGINVYTLWCGENQNNFHAGETATASNSSKQPPQKHNPKHDCLVLLTALHVSFAELSDQRTSI